MGVIASALLGSFWVRVVGLVFAGLLAIKANGLAREWQGEVRGAAKVTAVVTKKANDNVDTAQRVGAAVEAGKGRKNPYVRVDK